MAETAADQLEAWLADHLPAGWADAATSQDDERLDELQAEMDLDAFLDALGAAGWQTPMWDPEHGGLGLSPTEAREVEATMIRQQVPRGFDFVGRALVAACIKSFGSSEQLTMLNDIARSRVRWCQLFSEPGSGSDLAGLSTRAVKDGDVWVVNGQKVWSSWAQRSDWGILLARTDPDQAKHKGITCFLLDMTTPGIDVRPLRQMTGDDEFNEVFFNDVAISDSMRLGPVDEGWMVSTTALMNERGSLSGRPKVGRGIVDQVIDEAKERGTWSDPVVRDRLMTLWCAERANQMTALRSAAGAEAGRPPGPEASAGKLAGSELNQRIAAARIDLMGPAATAYDEVPERPEPNGRGELTMVNLDAQFLFLYSPASTILGGTSNIQRNIIGERVLGLPREPDPFKGAPWSEVPRN